MTTIRGGSIPFRGFQAGVRSRIEAINFEAPLLSAIIITRSTGSEIVGNRVARVVPTGPPFQEGRGIKFLGNDDPDGAITGSVQVVGNLIEDMHAQLSDAIVFDAVAADVEIAHNRIETVQSSGILIISTPTVRLRDNVVIPGPGDEGSFGNGILVLGVFGAQKQRVVRNTVICQNPRADGIILVGSHNVGPVEAAAVQDNHVVMNGSLFGAVTLAGSVRGAHVTGNRIEGDGAFGLFVDGSGPAQLAESNVLGGNRVANFKESVADAYFGVDTLNNVLRGRCGTVIDLGVGNDIACEDEMRPRPASVSRIGRVEAKMRELLRMLSPADSICEPE